ncbi:MAG: DUF4062 domain-containing protein [Methanoregula sp.]
MPEVKAELAPVPSVNKKYEVRRILNEREIDEFERFQPKATVFYDHYPNHRQWFENAVKELRDGDRVAFGIYSPIIEDRGITTLKLIGSLMLKKKPFSDVVVLKNLFLEHEYRNNQEGYGTALCNAAELYCAKGGFSKIVTEVPYSEYNTINFLLFRKYQVEKTIESPYKKGDFLCEMYKKITPLYHGDFFDFQGLAKWILENIYGFENIDRIDDTYLTFAIKTKAPSNKIKDVSIVPKGLAAIFSQMEILDDKNCESFLERSKQFQFCIIFCNSIAATGKQKLIDRGVVVIDNDIIKSSLCECFAYKPPSFDKKEISGIIVTIKPEYLDIATYQQSKFTYLKGGNVGQSLKKDDYVFFYTDISDNEKVEGIRGYGKVATVQCGSKEEIWEQFKDSQPLFTRDDYKKFAEKKKLILGIVIEHFRQIETITPIELKEIVGSDIGYEEFSQLYINHRHSSKILELKKEIEPYEDIELNPDAPRVFISSTYLDLKKDRGELRKTLKSDLRYHAYAFERSGSGYPAREIILTKLEKSGVVIILIGERYGDPMNFEGDFISPIEDEFNHAQKWRKHILCYVKQGQKREERLNDFLKRVAEYQKGTKYQEYTSIDELKNFVKNDLGEYFNKK